MALHGVDIFLMSQKFFFQFCFEENFVYFFICQVTNNIFNKSLVSL